MPSVDLYTLGQSTQQVSGYSLVVLQDTFVKPLFGKQLDILATSRGQLETEKSGNSWSKKNILLREGRSEEHTLNSSHAA